MGASRAAAASSLAPPAEAAALRWLETLDDATDWIEDLDDPALMVLVLRQVTARVTERLLRRLGTACAGRPATPAPPAPVDRMLRIEEVAALLGVTVSHIRHLPPGAIPGRRQLVAGGRVVWSERAVRAFMESAPAKS